MANHISSILLDLMVCHRPLNVLNFELDLYKRMVLHYSFGDFGGKSTKGSIHMDVNIGYWGFMQMDKRHLIFS